MKEAKDKVIEKGLQERNQIVERTQPISGEGEEKKEDLKLSEEQKNLFEELSTRLEKELEEVATEARKIDLNPNCFVDHFDCDLNGSVAQADESVAKDLANYLWNELIPAVVSNVRERIIEPRDNSTLIGILHANGINVRYLGRITQIVQGEEEIDSELTTKGEHRAAAMPLYCQELLVIEMIARGVKHLLNKYYRTNRGVYEAPAKTIAMLLNHIFQQITPKSTKDNNGGTASNSNAKESKSKSKNKKKVSSTGTAVQTASSILEICLVDATVDTDSCLSSLRAIIFEKYGCYINFSVDHQAVAAVPTVTRDFLINRITPKTLLRRVCQLSGISIVPRSYDFASSAIFDISDIVGLQPIVKSCVRESISNEYELAMKVAMQLLQNNNLAAAFEYTQEAANIIHQVSE